MFLICIDFTAEHKIKKRMHCIRTEALTVYDTWSEQVMHDGGKNRWKETSQRQYKVKLVLSGHSKLDKTKILMKIVA